MSGKFDNISFGGDELRAAVDLPPSTTPDPPQPAPPPPAYPVAPFDVWGEGLTDDEAEFVGSVQALGWQDAPAWQRMFHEPDNVKAAIAASRYRAGHPLVTDALKKAATYFMDSYAETSLASLSKLADVLSNPTASGQGKAAAAKELLANIGFSRDLRERELEAKLADARARQAQAQATDKQATCLTDLIMAAASARQAGEWKPLEQRVLESEVINVQPLPALPS
jgi:hypothetical protein